MTNNKTEALKRLSQVVKPQLLTRLGVVEQSFLLLIMPDIDQLKATRRRLADILRAGFTERWISEGKLIEVFAAAASLWKYDQTYVSGEGLAACLKRLVNSEITPGGPYQEDGEVMVEANIFIAFFVGIVAKPLPKVDAFLQQVIQEDQYGQILNKWYQHFLLARLYPDGIKPVKFTSVAPSFTGRARPTVDQLMMTAAILGQEPDAPTEDTETAFLQSQKKLVVGKVLRRVAEMDEPLRSLAVQTVKKVAKVDANAEITVLPQLFLDEIKTSTMTKEQCQLLGCANVCTWVAYTLYDDIIDNEAGANELLPLANVAMRLSLEYYRTALPHCPTFWRYVDQVFSGMDAANMWELQQCRFAVSDQTITVANLPQYGNRQVLAQRAFAHGLPLMAILSEAGVKYSARRHIEQGFSHYLIARQLCDDMHDWYDDVKAGQVTSVVAAILRDLRIKPGVHQLSTLLPKMQATFRLKTLPKVCDQTLDHLEKARRHYKASGLLQSSSVLYRLLDPLEATARRSLDLYEKGRALAGDK